MPVKPLAAARCSGRSPTSPLAFTSAPNFSSSFATCAVEKEMRFNWVSWAFFPQSGMWKRWKGTFYLLVAVIWGDMQGGKKHGILNVHRRSVLQQYVCCLVGGGLLGICATHNGNWCWTFHLHPLLSPHGVQPVWPHAGQWGHCSPPAAHLTLRGEERSPAQRYPGVHRQTPKHTWGETMTTVSQWPSRLLPHPCINATNKALQMCSLVLRVLALHQVVKHGWLFNSSKTKVSVTYDTCWKKENTMALIQISGSLLRLLTL